MVSREPFPAICAHDGVESEQRCPAVTDYENQSQANERGTPMKKKISRLVLWPLLLVPFASLPLLAQSTAFTYQGQLTYKGALVNGNYDLQFVLYDAQAGGKLVAGPLPMYGVAVANGLLTVRLDFGAGVFTGPPRWMEISVKPQVGGAAFSALSPLQE